MVKAIINVRIYDFVNYIENGYVIFDKKIIASGPMSLFKNKGYQVIDGKGQLLLPGLVCCHTHIYSIFARGMSLPFNPHNFQEILDQLWWKMDHYIDNKTTFYSGVVAAREYMLNGVTTLIDHHASGTDILSSLENLKKAVVDEAHMRALFAFETSDRYPVDLAIKENKNFIAKHRDEHVAGLFGLHASMSLSDKTLDLVHKSLNGAPIHIHVAESDMDEADCLKKYRERIINRLDRFQLLTPNSLIVHGVYVNDDELKIIKARQVYMVCNTTSNMNNAVGLPNIKNFLNHKIKVLIGNDGLSSNIANEYVNALFTSHLKNDSPTTLNLGDILQMINYSYEYVGKMLKIKLGQIAGEFEADFMLLPYTPPTKMDQGNAFGHIFYGIFNALKPQEVYASGRRVVHNYKAVNKRLNRDYDDAHIVADELWNRIKKGE
ncbi:MAG: amidohydrolase family protein [Bacilli bacterium]|jgi:cytosine/adenosine deaminase-related metal-dependent hydrolase